MKNHDMHLNEEPFNLIKEGKKDIEYRVNDEKRRNLQIGDTITFYKRSLNTEKVEVLVTDLRYYDTLLEMYSATFERDFKNCYDSPQAVVEDSSYYTNEEVEQYGCVAVYLKKISK